MTEYDYVATYQGGKYHSFTEEASVIRTRGDKCMGVNLHKLCGLESPIHKNYDNCDRFWYKDGIKHRDDNLPAVIYGIENSNMRWYVNGKKHNDDGPAYINTGHKCGWEIRWYIKGLKHREDGPAVVKSDGTMEWYEKGELMKSKKKEGFNKENKEYMKYLHMIEVEEGLQNQYQ
jgi:hypothetical protein